MLLNRRLVVMPGRVVFADVVTKMLDLAVDFDLCLEPPVPLIEANTLQAAGVFHAKALVAIVLCMGSQAEIGTLAVEPVVVDVIAVRLAVGHVQQ